MFENPRRGRQARNLQQIFRNSRSQIVFRTEFFWKLTLGAPVFWKLCYRIRWLSDCFDEILLVVSKFPEPEKKLIQKAQTICKLPATSAADERSFSSARRLKTWLPSRMGDLAVLNGHKRRTDSVSIATQEFVSRNKNRKRSFGTQEVYLTYCLYWIV